MPVLSLTVDAILDSAHKLTCVPEGHKCRNLHGHTYTVQVTIERTVDTFQDMIVETGLVQDAIMQFDHCYLNEKFKEVGVGQMQTTIENIARVIMDEVDHILPDSAQVASVDVQEGFGASARILSD